MNSTRYIEYRAENMAILLKIAPFEFWSQGLREILYFRITAT